ncbi:class I SAM-dependent methyltransferase [Lichenifustis flavocetrariae]|uniref:Class I SAM-dependent methyltransferase n=1 Tax=Lichenifustis flavocetrariae TaxID=2949735 RepID=A0AA41YV27_9HYPH|nr:class I SAM-dependent methyltransferase [Lichenifustis flavocetrariae]MCW6508664.1 class I SAM-dependent methyltransferase [Lichenifustis flavocetrariae]
MGAAPVATALMDRIYRHQRFIYDITRRYYLLGRDQLIADLAPGQGSVLEIGCGTGRNLAAVARRYPAAHLYGLDVSAAMLQTANAAFTRRNLRGRIRTALADATAFDPQACFGQPKFDRIFFSYTLSMIPDWRAALEQAATRLAPGGRLMIVDFGQLDGYPSFMRRALFAWLRAFHVHPIASLPTTLAAMAGTHGLSLQCRPLFGGYAVAAVLQRADAAVAASH